MGTTSDIQWWLNQAGRFPLLSPDQELTLGRMVQQWLEDPSPSAAATRRGRRARDRLVQSNLRLVVTVARKYQRHVSSAMGFADLIQGGNVGLIRAAEKFDPSRGYRFSTYAYWWISQGVCSVVDRESRTIRMPTTFAPRLQQLGKATQRLIGELGREPSRQELAQALGMRLEDLDRVMSVGSRAHSLDRLRAEDGEPFLDALAAPGPDQDDDQLQELRRRLEQLPHTLAAIVIGRWGLDGCGRQTFQSLAREHGCTVAEAKGRLALAMRLLGEDSRPVPAAAEHWSAEEQLSFLSADPAPPADATAAARRVVVRRRGRSRSPVQQLSCWPA